MDIPKLQKFFLPVLKSIGSREISSIREVVEDMKTAFDLKEEQMNQRVRNKTKTVVYDKVTWAMTYLFKARLIDKKGVGRRSITAKGKEVLRKKPKTLNWSDLKLSSDNLDSPDKKHLKSSSEKSECKYKEMSPNEIMEEAFKELKQEVLTDLLNKLRDIQPNFFEEIILELLKKMGYGNNTESLQHIEGTGDGGMDGVIFQDALGCDRIYIQVKRYGENSVVGRPEIQGFNGALDSNSCKKGIFITTSRFSEPAKEEIARVSSRLVLIDGDRLAELFYQYNVGLKTKDVFEYKEVDESFFESEGE